MKSETLPGAEALLAERARLENLLAVSEDWRALQQLRARAARGEGVSAINAASLEALLVDALNDNPFFGPYKSVCLAIDQLAQRSNAANGAKAQGSAVQPVGADDLTRIRGVDAALAKRLREIDVTTFAEIAEWRAADIQKVAKDLNLGKQIHSQNWIEQAALYALTSPNKAPKKQPPPAPPVVPQAAGQVSRAPSAPVAATTPTPSVAPKTAIADSAPTAPASPLDEEDPNQLTLDFSRKQTVAATTSVSPSAAAPEPAQVKVAQSVAAPVATATGTKAAEAVVVDAKRQPSVGQFETPSVAPAKSGDPEAVPYTVEQPVAKPQSPPATVETAPPVVARSGQPLPPIGQPPRPLVPWRYGQAPAAPVPTVGQAKSVAEVAVSTANEPKAAQMPVAPAQAAAPLTPATLPPLGPPPRPLVVTQASLPPRDTVKTVAPAAALVLPTIASAAVPPAAAASVGTPSMSIAEAIAYAAEIARQSQKDDSPADAKADAKVNLVSSRPVPPPVPATVENDPPPAPVVAAAVKPAEAPPPLAAAAPAPSSKPLPLPPAVPPRPAAIVTPPPLPASFKAPEPPPPAPQQSRPQPRATRVEHARPVEREDFANRSNVEEASVEIVRRQGNGSSPVMDPAVAAALAASNAQAKARPAGPDSDAEKSAPRGGTPIGRFLKALTGN